MKKILFILYSLNFIVCYCQKKERIDKITLGSSFFNLNENFDDLFLFNNSSPIIIGIRSTKYRLESITNISIINDNNSNFIRGSIRLNLDYIFRLSKKMEIYLGPQYGLNSNRTNLLNLHLGGEYFLLPNWSISNQIGLNFLFDDQKSLQTNSNIILRFYINTRKAR